MGPTLEFRTDGTPRLLIIPFFVFKTREQADTHDILNKYFTRSSYKLIGEYPC